MTRFFCNGKKGYCSRVNDCCIDCDIDCTSCEFTNGTGGEFVDCPDTNFERIRNMSVEKFAAQLLIKFDSEMGIYETDASVFNTYGEALKAKIKWLETEVSDE